MFAWLPRVASWPVPVNLRELLGSGPSFGETTFQFEKAKAENLDLTPFGTQHVVRTVGWVKQTAALVGTWLFKSRTPREKVVRPSLGLR